MNLNISFLIFFSILFSTCSPSYSQSDSFNVEFIKAKKKIKAITTFSANYKSNNVNKISVKIKIESTEKKGVFDPNKISLIDHENNLRFRPTDVLAKRFTNLIPFGRVSKVKPKLKRNKKLYAPEIKDTYLDYNFDGIQNVDLPFNYGTTKKPDLLIMHFYSKKLRSTTLTLFFAYPKNAKTGTLYYGNEKISDISI
ncbi:hypothetical protein [Bizionia paragorgiae]|uniref:hypothetical protein n=1 Tax=Bizionia paragorgiae TaxID=283786 RepID=UPI00299D481C|nr:hypothetical protein [Bizionia paragorgiae]MDX1270714.1 hypothetical protein [Bizionia paragorgiae]